MNQEFVVKQLVKLFSDRKTKGRFWLDVEKSDGCWNWIGSKHRQGYGLFSCLGKSIKAHRAAFFLANNCLILDMKVLHKCDNPSCVNPDHLSLGTQAENVADMMAKGRNKLPPWKSGEENHRSKLTWPAVRDIRAQYKNGGISQQKLAKAFGVAPMTINRIVNQEMWHDH